jgi:hypothetical protein
MAFDADPDVTAVASQPIGCTGATDADMLLTISALPEMECRQLRGGPADGVVSLS